MRRIRFPSAVAAVLVIFWGSARAGDGLQPVQSLPGEGGKAPGGMAEIPGGLYRPPFQAPDAGERVWVAPFRLDKHAVTVGEFLVFLRSHPQFARSKVKRLFADSQYLISWKGDFTPPRERLKDPVTEVSWFSAKAYCAEANKRLPSTVEWERVATTPPPGRDSSAYAANILEWYGRPAAKGRVAGAGSVNAFGVMDLHGKIWEWTSDFNATGLGGGNSRGTLDSAFFCGGAGQATAKGVDYPTFMRFSFRSSLKPDFAVGSLGFRCAQGERSDSNLPDSSLYQLKSIWTADDGSRVRLESLRGKPRLVTMFFGHCESSCPMVVAGLKTVASSLPADWGLRAGIVLVSLDPRRDDVESLAEYREHMALSRNGWTLLSGREEDTRELAMAMGVAYRPSTKNGGVEHNALVALLDKDGRVLARHEGAVEAAALTKEFLGAMADTAR